MFKTTAQDGLARCGSMVLRNAAVATPTPMVYTRRGGCLFLTPDMLEKLRPEAQLVQINALQFLHLPSPDVLRSYGRSAHHYIGLPGWPLFASNRDATLAEYYGGARPSNDAAAYATLHTGGTHVSPERYMDAIAALQPEVFVALADEVPSDARPKRVAQSVDRTLKWLDECIRRHNSNEQQQLQQEEERGGAEGSAAGACGASEGGGGSPSGRQLFAPVVGAASAEQRARSAKAAAERDVAGFALCGFGTGERSSARPELLAAALQHLPADKPRVAVGLDTPDDVLDAVLQGIDLFDCSYPTHATANGYALCFALAPPGQAGDKQQQQEQQCGVAEGPVGGVDADQGVDDTKMNLWALDYRMDKRPLVPGCGCFACRNHSRAYIHHLLHTHEMLAGVLLETHNTHWWLGFFSAVREAIRRGALAQYAEWFRRQREAARMAAPEP